MMSDNEVVAEIGGAALSVDDVGGGGGGGRSLF